MTQVRRNEDVALLNQVVENGQIVKRSIEAPDTTFVAGVSSLGTQLVPGLILPIPTDGVWVVTWQEWLQADPNSGVVINAFAEIATSGTIGEGLLARKNIGPFGEAPAIQSQSLRGEDLIFEPVFIAGGSSVFVQLSLSAFTGGTTFTASALYRRDLFRGRLIAHRIGDTLA